MNTNQRPSWAVVGNKIKPSEKEKDSRQNCCSRCRSMIYAVVQSVSDSFIDLQLYNAADIQTGNLSVFVGDKDCQARYSLFDDNNPAGLGFDPVSGAALDGDISGSFPLPTVQGLQPIEMRPLFPYAEYDFKTEPPHLLLKLEAQLAEMENKMNEMKITIKQLRNQIV